MRIPVLGYGAIVEGTGGDTTARLVMSSAAPAIETWGTPAPGAAASSAAEDTRYTLATGKLEKQFEYLAAGAYYTPVVEDFVQNRIDAEKSGKAVILTFDGGLEAHYRLVFPLLQKYKLRASFFLPVDRLDKPGGLQRGELDLMVKWGMGIGALVPPADQLLKKPSHEIADELSYTRRRLTDAISRPITTLAISGRKLETTSLVRVAYDHGYHGLVSTEVGNHYQKEDLLIISRYMARRTATPEEWRSIVRMTSLGPAKLAFFVRPLTMRTGP